MPVEPGAAVTFERLGGLNGSRPAERLHPARVLPGTSLWFYDGGGAEITLATGARHRIRPGEGRLIQARAWHSVQHEGGPQFRVSGCNFRALYLGGIDLFTLANFPVRIAAGRIDRVRPLVQTLNNPCPLHAASGPADAVRWKHAAYALLDEMLSWAAVPIALPPKSSPVGRLLPAITLMRASMGKPLARADLARETGLSEAAFGRLFQKAFGQSPLDHFRRMRIEEAQHLLLSTSLNLAEIAARLAFTDEFHLSKVFKRLTGEPPSAFRRRAPL